MEGSAHGPPAVPRLPGFSWPSALGQGLQKGDCGSGGQLAEKGGSYWGLGVGSPDPLRSMMLLSLYKQRKETTAQRDRLFCPGFHSYRKPVLGFGSYMFTVHLGDLDGTQESGWRWPGTSVVLGRLRGLCQSDLSWCFI